MIELSFYYKIDFSGQSTRENENQFSTEKNFKLITF